MGDTQQYLSTQEVADELGCHVREVRKLVNLDLLRAWRVGRTIRVTRSALNEFLAGGNIGATGRGTRS